MFEHEFPPRVEILLYVFVVFRFWVSVGGSRKHTVQQASCPEYLRCVSMGLRLNWEELFFLWWFGFFLILSCDFHWFASMLMILVRFSRLSSILSCQVYKWCVSSITSYRQVYVLSGPVCNLCCISWLDDVFCVLPYNKTLIRGPIRTWEAACLLGTLMKTSQWKVRSSEHASRAALMICFEKCSEAFIVPQRFDVHNTNNPAFKGTKQFLITLGQ